MKKEKNSLEEQRYKLAMSWGTKNAPMPPGIYYKVKDGKLTYISERLVIVEGETIYPKPDKA